MGDRGGSERGPAVTARSLRRTFPEGKLSRRGRSFVQGLTSNGLAPSKGSLEPRKEWALNVQDIPSAIING